MLLFSWFVWVKFSREQWVMVELLLELGHWWHIGNTDLFIFFFFVVWKWKVEKKIPLEGKSRCHFQLLWFEIILGTNNLAVYLGCLPVLSCSKKNLIIITDRCVLMVVCFKIWSWISEWMCYSSLNVIINSLFRDDSLSQKWGYMTQDKSWVPTWDHGNALVSKYL